MGRVESNEEGYNGWRVEFNLVGAKSIIDGDKIKLLKQPQCTTTFYLSTYTKTHTVGLLCGNSTTRSTVKMPLGGAT